MYYVRFNNDGSCACTVRATTKGSRWSKPSEKLKEGDVTMPIKWSPLKVAEALEMIEHYVNQAVEPLEQARIVAPEARNIANLPQYMDQHLVWIIGEIDRSIGSS